MSLELSALSPKSRNHNLFDAVFRGTALVSGNHLYALLAHPTTGAPLLGICNMGKSERLVLMDGLILFCRDGYGGVPTAAICMVERIGDLTGDDVADDALYADLVARNPPVIDAALPQATRAILLRDIGPAAAAAGGDLGMIMPFFRTLARGE